MLHLFLRDKKLSDYSTFGIGGPIQYFIEVKDIRLMQEVISFASSEKIPYFILGKGSNCLFPDTGFDGIVIANRIEFIEDNANGTVHVGAGFSFSLLGTQTAKKGFSGLEFAAGIPASVGGAVFMNAGAQGQETANALVSVDYIDQYGEKHILKKEELSFAYRTSSFQTMTGAIVGATFELIPRGDARAQQLQLLQYRIDRQPYSEKSCGCIFRNPEGVSAGLLIEKSGLKGFSIGGAEVSLKHANFIINRGHATACDILHLIDAVKKRVYECHGVVLESEIRIISDGV